MTSHWIDNCYITMKQDLKWESSEGLAVVITADRGWVSDVDKGPRPSLGLSILGMVFPTAAASEAAAVSGVVRAERGHCSWPPRCTACERLPSVSCPQPFSGRWREGRRMSLTTIGQTVPFCITARKESQGFLVFPSPLLSEFCLDRLIVLHDHLDQFLWEPWLREGFAVNGD